MKVEELHKTFLKKIDNSDRMGIGGAELRIVADDQRSYCAAAYADGDGFENEDEALKAAALFRSSYVMQEALRNCELRLSDLHRQFGVGEWPELTEARAALTLSENTDEAL